MKENNKHINIILTYNKPHRKTYDLLCNLKAVGVNDVVVVALPWVEMKQFVPLYPHRPPAIVLVTPAEVSKNLGYHYIELAGMEEFGQYLKEFESKNRILVAGAGVIPQNIVTDHICINAHPGLLPHMRGLDALKWAIYENEEIGVTLYRCGGKVDTGELIEKRVLKLHLYDTFFSIAQRLYELEITMLASGAVIDIGKGDLLLGTGRVNKRMPHRKEILLEDLLRQRILIDKDY